MKRQSLQYFLLTVLLWSSFSIGVDVPELDNLSSPSQANFMSPSGASPSDLPFNYSALNWSFQKGLAFEDFHVWYYYHYNISCSVTQLNESPTTFIFNFTFQLQIDMEKGEEEFFGLHGIGDLSSSRINAFWLLEVDLYHENSVDLSYLYLSNHTNDYKSGSYTQSLVIVQESAPLGFFYHVIFAGMLFGKGTGESLNILEQPSYYDGDTLWVKDLTNFSFMTHFHMKHFDFSLQFLGSFDSFLGDGIAQANSTIHMNYQQEINLDPLMVSAFNVSLSLRSSFGNVSEISGSWSIQDYQSEIRINQTNYQNPSLQEFIYMAENSMDGFWYVIDDVCIPGMFNNTFPTQNIVFQIGTIPQDVIFDMPIKQMVISPSDPDSEISEENTVGGFAHILFSVFLGVSVLYFGALRSKRTRRMSKV